MAFDFFAGCCGGLAGTLVGHPFDTIKVRLQNQEGPKLRYHGTIHCFSQIIKHESIFAGVGVGSRQRIVVSPGPGFYLDKKYPLAKAKQLNNGIWLVTGLYKGLGSPLIGQLFINAIVFGVHGNMIKRYEQDSLKGQFEAGLVAGAVQTLICGPMELVKTRMQLQCQGRAGHTQHQLGRRYDNSLDCLFKIYKTEGIQGCSRGMLATLIREVPSFGVYFASYYGLCQITDAEKGPLNLIKLLLCGGTSGIAAWVVTYPMDVIKTRLQAEEPTSLRYKGILDCAIQSYRQDGIRVFFKGLNATLIRAFPANAATLATVTFILQLGNKDSTENLFISKEYYTYDHVLPTSYT